MSNISSLEVDRTHSKLCFLNPLQSLSQFVSIAVTLTIGLCLLALVSRAAFPNIPVLIVLTPAAIGGLAPLYAVLPGRLVVRVHALSVTAVTNQVLSEMSNLGYRERVPEHPARRFRTCRPRWQRWLENELTIVSGEQTVEVTGPIFAVRMLLTRITTALGK